MSVEASGKRRQQRQPWQDARRGAVTDFHLFMLDHPELSLSKGIALFVSSYRERTRRPLSKTTLWRLLAAEKKGPEAFEAALTYRGWGGSRKTSVFDDPAIGTTLIGMVRSGRGRVNGATVAHFLRVLFPAEAAILSEENVNRRIRDLVARGDLPRGLTRPTGRPSF
ncbi:MAG: hypothetical protein AAB654_08050 [Acidobacteriota bacterium]